MKVFFYGLFMDRDVLIKNGIHPSNSCKGYLNNYTLKIGNRASLVPCENEKAYGIVMEVIQKELVRLYAEKSVADYIPKNVEITTELNEHLSAICYNLPSKSIMGTNALYAKSLYELAKKLNFPQAYLEKIYKQIPK